jgi:hypothetical protein
LPGDVKIAREIEGAGVKPMNGEYKGNLLIEKADDS